VGGGGASPHHDLRHSGRGEEGVGQGGRPCDVAVTCRQMLVRADADPVIGN
jgi:hypothetical protein